MCPRHRFTLKITTQATIVTLIALTCVITPGTALPAINNHKPITPEHNQSCETDGFTPANPSYCMPKQLTSDQLSDITQAIVLQKFKPHEENKHNPYTILCPYTLTDIDERPIHVDQFFINGESTPVISYHRYDAPTYLNDKHTLWTSHEKTALQRSLTCTRLGRSLFPQLPAHILPPNGYDLRFLERIMHAKYRRQTPFFSRFKGSLGLAFGAATGYLLARTEAENKNFAKQQ